MNTRRLLGPVVLATLAAGGLAFFAASRTWAHVRVASDGLPSDSVDVTGADAQPLVSALAVVVLTAALAVLAASPRVRRVVGGFTVLVAVAGVAIVLLGSASLDSAVEPGGRGVAGIHRHGTPDFSTTAWSYVAVVGFVVAATAGGITARFGATWPTMSSRYEAPAARAVVASPQSDSDMWKALDEGRDPTQ